VHELNFDGRNCAGVTQMTPGKITQEMIVKQDAPDNALPHELGHCRTITHNPGDIGTGTSIPTEEHLMWPDNSLNNWLKMAPITSKFEKP